MFDSRNLTLQAKTDIVLAHEAAAEEVKNFYFKGNFPLNKIDEIPDFLVVQ